MAVHMKEMIYDGEHGVFMGTGKGLIYFMGIGKLKYYLLGNGK